MASRYHENLDSDKISSILEEKSEEISNSLILYMRQREHAVNKVDAAKQEFEAEMLRLTSCNMYEYDNHQITNDVDPPANVDHNIMRHLHIANPGENNNFDDAYENEFGDQDEQKDFRIEQSGSGDEAHHPQHEHFGEEQVEYHVEIKHDAPSFENKENLRTKMFSMLDEARIAELNLEEECDSYREQENSLRLLHEAEDCLYDLKRHNGNQLMSMMHEYQPAPFGRAWGNDPDYAILTTTLKEMLTSPEETPNVAASLTGSKKKVKKKKAVRK